MIPKESDASVNQKFGVNQVMIYIPVSISTNSNGSEINYTQLTLQQEATPNAEATEFMSCPNTPSQPGSKAQECITSPSAQQFAKNVLDTTSSSIKYVQLASPSMEKPRTRSAAQFKIR